MEPPDPLSACCPVLEDYSERLEHLEEKVLSDAEKSSISQIHDVRRDLLTLRRGMWPLRESLSSLLRETPSIIAADTRPFLRDCADHAGQILAVIAAGLMVFFRRKGWL